MRTLTTAVIVLGLGPGGGQVAEDLASAGVDVVGIDAGLVGGECPYWGCVPSKRMIRAASALAEARRVDGLAGTATVVPDWAPVHAWIADVATDHWDDRVAVERLEGKGGTFLRGHGRLDGPRTVVVATPEGEEVTVTASLAVVVATGSAPAVPPIEGLAGTPYWTNHEMIESPVLPRSIVVLGASSLRSWLASASTSRSWSTRRASSPSRSQRRDPFSPRCSRARASPYAPGSVRRASSMPPTASP